jgi:protein-disulfide isomerase
MRFIKTIGICALLASTWQCGRAPDGDANNAKQAPAPAQAPAKNGVTAVRVPVDGLPSIGRDDALVTIVEFTDYQCPYCGRAEKTMAILKQTYGDDVRFVIASHPLPFHSRAEPAARAALAAAEQGKFADMHARLFANAKALDDDSIKSAASELGLDTTRFESARTGAKVSADLDRAMALAKSLGVTGTPSFFVNGRRINGAQPLETFKGVVDEEISHARALVSAGTRRADVYAKIMESALAKAPADTAGDAPGCGGDSHGECAGDGKPEVDDKVIDVRVDDSPIRGFARAPVTVVAFIDFECPFCAKAQPTFRDLQSAYDGNVRVVFKNLPLPMHDHARMAAKAAIAAGNQGRFWEYHDALFAHQTALDRASLESYAKTLGLDMARFTRDLDAPETEARVAADEAQAHALGVQGTPTAFVNGRRVIGAQPLTVFKATVDKTMAPAK